MLGRAVLVTVLACQTVPLLAQIGWQELPNTSLQSVCPPNNYQGQNYAFASFCSAVITAWSGGIVDTSTNRLIIWGGGHNDYYGNELYSLNLNSNPPALTRLTDPSPINTSQDCTVTTLSDGKPNARHTTNSLVYIAHVNRMFVFNGGVACQGSNNNKDTWTLDLGTLQWQRMDPTNGVNMTAGWGNFWSIAAYDPNTKTVFINWTDMLFQYTYETNTYTQLSQAHVPYAGTGVIDPKRKLFIFMGAEYQNPTPHIMAINIAPGSNYSVQDWTSQTSGCDPLSSAYYPGLAYDPTLDRIVGWPNAGNSVYLFNPDTKTCSVQTFPNGPRNAVPSNLSGTFGRFRYFPALNAYGVVSEADLNGFLLRLSATAPTGDVTPPAVSMTAPASGATLSKTVTISANASDNVGVVAVQFKLDGVNLGASISTAPYILSWDTTTISNGSHNITAVAVDAAGNAATAGAVNITVNNGSGTVVPSSPSPVDGLGGSTFTCLDRDGDGFGVGPGCVGIDADDLDATVQTAAQGIAKYGSLSAFAAKLGNDTGNAAAAAGYGSPNHTWYLAPATASPAGSDSNACNSPSAPCLTETRLSTVGLTGGDLIILRNGWNGRITLPNGTASKHTVVLSYPGEQALLTGASGNVIDIIDTAYVTIDGVMFTNFSGIAGGTHDGAATSLNHDVLIRHIDGSQASDAPVQMTNGLQNITIEDSVFHDNDCSGGSCQHGVYLGSRQLPSQNVTVRRNIFYHNAWSGFHFNGRVTNLVFDQNIVYNNGSSGLSLQQGVNHSFIRSNLIFNNTNAMQFYNYQGACLDPTQGNAQYICPYDQNYNLIENNVLYNTGMDAFDQTTAQGNPTIQIQNDTTGCPYSTGCVAPQVPAKQGDLGHNTYRNNIIVGWGNTSGAPNYYHPPVQAVSCQAGTSAYFGGTCVFDNTETYLATSTFDSNIFWEVGTYPDSNIIGWGPLGYGYNAYNCSTAKTITNITGACASADPKFVNASASLWNAATTFNFKLQSSSPAIHAGSVTAVPAYDIVGNIFGNPPSVGAYEPMPGTTLPTPSISCDLNGDGRIDSLDIQLAINQAIGVTACGSADLQQNGQCNVIDVQRVINASLGAACMTGP